MCVCTHSQKPRAHVYVQEMCVGGKKSEREREKERKKER